MPVGIQRLNAKKTHPNDRIIFIKPLKGPDGAVSQEFLERIAAQCLPIMKENHLSVMSLEEYEPNAEFVGRNFNAGEVIQLVLKARFTGHWLPFNYVQMVMMHELAHCKQMNHSRAFWAVRNQYADQMRTLWGRKYTGDGLWGRGALLETGEFEKNTIGADEALPEHLCGGTYRSRGRKRQIKPTLTYQERKERRIAKKFGRNGVPLGEDEEAKAKLEKGRHVRAKPRVANSARGRELRAAAALARFEEQKTKKEDETEKIKDEDETASGSDTDDYDDGQALSGIDALDLDGRRLLDTKGRGMVKVCEDENPDDQDAQKELLELQSSYKSHRSPENTPINETAAKERVQLPPRIKEERPDTYLTAYKRPAPEEKNVVVKSEEPPDDIDIASSLAAAPRNPWAGEGARSGGDVHGSLTCPICSFVNDRSSAACGRCLHVLEVNRVPDTWRCRSDVCEDLDSGYLNAGDCRFCGVCGRPPSLKTKDSRW